ncbi:MAG: DNA-3-methyladenine glycosylase 2 family protein [Acidobacteriota bacterium]|nr:DNA-3-methyladenine glycosylase 2 family protein [Acidobacteriota bacterium]
MIDDAERCYQATKSRDARFDGVFITGVLTTGIYCRPSCPARTPRRENVRFFATAAAAQQAGLRACLRCRPDATPGSPEWNVRADLVARAMRLIRDGVVDREGVSGLAERLGYSERHLNRVLSAEVGAGPLALARAQRSQNARTLLETTDLPITQIAFAAGFDSVRQCNETIRQVFALTPRELRLRASETRTSPDWAAQGIELRLPARRPFSASSVLGFLGERAIAGIEDYDGTTFRRSLRLPRGPAIVELSPGTDSTHGPAFVLARLYLSNLRDLTAAVARCRQLLDLDADPLAVLEVLGEDPWIGPLVSREPGRRIAGAVDGFELAVRAIIGQQVSVSGARTIAARLVGAAGERLAEPRAGVTHLFPTAEALADLASQDASIFAMPATRRRALAALAGAVRSGELVIDPGTDPIELRQALVALSGIGPWTAEYVAMRALRDPDAFLGSDLGILRAAATLGLPDDTRGFTRAAQSWRPWRSYAMAHLWALPTNVTRSTSAKEIA